MSDPLVAKLDLILIQTHAMRACAEVLAGMIEEARGVLAQPDVKVPSEAEDLLNKIQEEGSKVTRPVFGLRHRQSPAPEPADPVSHPQGGE